MRHQWRLAIAASALLMLGVPTFAQATHTPPPPPAGARPRPMGGFAFLLLSPMGVIDSITPLRPDQKTSIEAIHSKLRSDLQAADQSRDNVKMADLRHQAALDIKALLSADQVDAIRRFVPSAGFIDRSHVFPIHAMVDIKLTPDQITQIEALTKIEEPKARGLQGADRRTQMAVIYDDFKNHAEAMLTPQQKEAIATYNANHPRTEQTGIGDAREE